MSFAQLRQEFARAHVLVSASRVESYGMAIAEARASGCIVLARRGGHVARLLGPADTLVYDDVALVEALLAVNVRSLPQQSPVAQRTWADVAREFLSVR